MFDFFKLKTGIQPHATLDGEDIFKTKSALNQLGYLNKPSSAKDDEDVSPVNDWASQDMFDATRTFQKDHGLTVDGIIKPNGETATALNKKLAERANVLMGEKTDGATTPEQPKLKSFDFWADQKRKAQPPTATELATTTPWFQSPTLPTVDGAVHSANGRAVKTLMNYTDPGEHPRWITEDIRNGVPNSVGMLGNLLVQLSQQDPAKAKTYSDRVLTQLPADKRAEIEKLGQIGTAPKTGFNPDAPAMDENGRWRDVQGNPVADPNADPNIRGAQATVPLPAPVPLPLPGTVFDPTSQANKDWVEGVRRQIDKAETWVKEQPTLPIGGPVGLPNPWYGGNGAKRTEAADPLPENGGIQPPRGVKTAPETYPSADPGQRPPVPPSMPQDPVGKIEGRPDQSGEMNEIGTLEMAGQDIKEVKAFAKKHGLDEHRTSRALEKMKKAGGMGGKKAQIDWATGTVYDPISGEEIGNLFDEK